MGKVNLRPNATRYHSRDSHERAASLIGYYSLGGPL